MNLSVKEKEKYVLKLREEGKTYRDIAHELHISPREISNILKKANGENEERKKIILSNTSKALQLYKKGKSPIEVAIKLDSSPEETQSLYFKYLSLNNLHHFVETINQFDNDSLQDFIHHYYFMKENGISKEEIVEDIRMRNDLPTMKEEYHKVSNQLTELQKERDFYLEDNELLISKNCELNYESNSLLLKIEATKRMLQLTENEINKKKNLLENINNSEDHTILKNKIEEQLNNFLNCKKDFFKLAITIIFDIIKKDPKKDIFISNIINYNGNSNSQFYLDYYEDKIAQIAADTLSNIALEIITNNILNS